VARGTRKSAAAPQISAPEMGVGNYEALDAASEGSPYDYETSILAVRHVYHVPDDRYGFHFKDTNEFGLYGIFYADDRDKPFETFHRSDANFEAEILLDHLHIDEPI
jgi:hypothetical protein